MIRAKALDQGTVIRGVVSDKYEGICCYGVIVSASCDIANEKIKNVYYLTAVDVKEWIYSEVGFSYAVKSKINNQAAILKEISKTYELDWTVLVKWNEEETKRVLTDVIFDVQTVNRFMKAYNIFNNLHKQCKTQSERKHKICENPEEFTKFIKEIDEGKYSQLYYLPRKSYEENGVEYDGLVVDMQEVSSIPWELASKLKTPGIDCRQLKPSDKMTLETWKQYFFLPSRDSYVSVEGIVESPRREHFMQQFSNGFIRIGVDRISNGDYDRMADYFKNHL